MKPILSFLWRPLLSPDLLLNYHIRINGLTPHLLCIDLEPANEVTEINLFQVAPSGRISNVFEDAFNPTFSYPIFGDDEQIFGYKELSIKLNFRAYDMKPWLTTEFKEKFKPIGETEAMDIEKMLKEFLPEDVDSSGVEVDAEAEKSWEPPGKLIHSYTIDTSGKKFHIYCTSLADTSARTIFKNMQILVPMFIEGGTCQNLEDYPWTLERWKLFLVYEVQPTPAKKDADTPLSPYVLCGFATSYRLWCPEREKDIVLDVPPAKNGTATGEGEHHQQHIHLHGPHESAERILAEKYDPLTARSRERISQFIILPPFQGQGHGAHLYSTLYHTFLTSSNIHEITVEDPNEAFDDLRDWCDLATLRSNEEFKSLRLPENVPKEQLRPDAELPVSTLIPESTLTALRLASKISPRQFSRLVEMHLFSTIPPRHRSTARITRKANAADVNDRRYYFWRLLVKERIWQKNRDQLMQYEDLSERVQHIEATLPGIEEEYTRITDAAAKGVRSRPIVVGVEQDDVAAGSKRKRKVIDDDEDEDEDDDEEPAGKVGGKKPKLI